MNKLQAAAEMIAKMAQQREEQMKLLKGYNKMDILECEVCKCEFSIYIDIAEEKVRYGCPYCRYAEDWE